jgi:hypothetical protein
MLTLRNRPHYDPGSAVAPEPVNSLRKTVLLVSAALVLVLATAAPAAAKSCGQKVIDDWYADAVVNDVYQLHCYRDALKLLPDDVQTYSSAPDDINRALVAEIRASQKTPPPPPSPATTGTTPPAGGGTKSSGSGPTKPGKSPGGSSKGSGGTKNGGKSGYGLGTSQHPSTIYPATTGGVAAAETNKGFLGDAVDKLGPSSPDSIPLPLIIVGALALLLLAAGSAGLLARRLNARKVEAEPPTKLPRRPGA